MNPSIPGEFFSSAQFTKSDWEVTLEGEDAEFQFPKVAAGAYSRLKILPLQTLLIQQILENPDFHEPVELPDELQEFLFQHLHDSGRLTASNVAIWAQKATVIDLTCYPHFSSSLWLPQLSNCTSLGSLHLLHVPIDIDDLKHLSTVESLTELSIGSKFNATEIDTTALANVFDRLSTFRLILPSSPSSAPLLDSLLDLLNGDKLLHLGLGLLGPTELPWQRICSKMKNLTFLKIDSRNMDCMKEVSMATANLPALTNLKRLHISYLVAQATEVLIDFIMTLQLPALTTACIPLVNDAKDVVTKLELTDELCLLLHGSQWKDYEVQLFPLMPTLTGFPVTSIFATDIDMEIWLRMLRYATHDLELFVGFLQILPNPVLKRFSELPSFPSTLMQGVRLYAESLAMWKELVPVFDFLFGQIKELASPIATVMMCLEEAEIRDLCLRKIIFEGLAPLFERAIEANPIDFTIPLSDDNASANQSSEISNEPKGRPLPENFSGHLSLVRVITSFARFPAKAVYPSRLCLSKSSVTMKYVASPWYLYYDSLVAFRQFLRVHFVDVTPNLEVCHALHEEGIVSTMEYILEQHEPTLRARDPLYAPMGDLCGMASPRQVHAWIEKRPSFCRKLLRALPHNTTAEWLNAISILASYHGEHTTKAPHPVICQELHENVLRASHLFHGALSSHVIVFASSFCQFCRRLFIEPTNPVACGHVNALTFMVTQSQSNETGFWTSIASWVLESKTQHDQWLMQLKTELLRGPTYLSSRPNDRAQLVDALPMDFFCFLSRLFWMNVTEKTNNITTKYADPVFLPWETSAALDSFSMLSQSPPFVDLIWSFAPISVFDWLEQMQIKLGLANQTLSALYHLSCFRCAQMCQTLTFTMRKIERDAHGGMKISNKTTTPRRLFAPIKWDEETQSEDLLSLYTETTFSLLFELPSIMISIAVRTIANLVFHSEPLRRNVQSSKYSPKLLAHLISAGSTTGDVLSALLLISEIFGDYSPSQRSELPTPVQHLFKSDIIFDNLKVASEAGQPWWSATAISLIRSIFTRSLRVALDINDFPESRHDVEKSALQLSAHQIERLTFLIDEAFRLTQTQDITTQEAAFQAILEALTVPEDLSTRQTRRVVSHVTRDLITQKYATILKAQAEFVHFGYQSIASDAYHKFTQLRDANSGADSI